MSTKFATGVQILAAPVALGGLAGDRQKLRPLRLTRGGLVEQALSLLRNLPFIDEFKHSRTLARR